MQARPQASIAQVERAIFSSAQRGAMDRERANRGAVHAGRALAALTAPAG